MKHDLLPLFRPPLMNAAGTLGFSPRPQGVVDLSRLGAFVTNPISLEPRTPAETRRVAGFPGGFLLHTGLPNPGLRAVLRQHAPRWAASRLPVIVHLLASSPDEVARLAARLEGVEGVMGLEIGLPPGAEADLALALLAAAGGELPVILNLPPERVEMLGPRLIAAGAMALSLQPPRGALPLQQTLAAGRLYGPSLLPQALAAVQAGARLRLPVIGAGGIYTSADAEAMLQAGAAAVQVDAALWGFWA